MANNPIKMYRLRQIINLHFKGAPTTRISEYTGLSRTTVRTYVERIKALGLPHGEWQSLSDLETSRLLIGNHRQTAADPRQSVLEALLPTYAKELKKPKVSMTGLWARYHAEHPDGYKQTMFRKYMNAHIERNSGYMVIPHKAGDKMFVDYAGDTLSYYDRETGEVIECQVFVAVLPCSQYTYVEAQRSQKQGDFIDGCQNAFRFFKGVTNAIVTDNLRSAVTKPNRYEPIINDAFAAFAEHYGTAVLPARVRKPRDKAMVEGAVRNVYNRIYPPVLEKEPLSLEELNLFIREELESYNEQPLKGGPSRLQCYMTEEREFMQPMPENAYEPITVRMAKVAKNGYVVLTEDHHYYSAPHTLIGRKLKIIHTCDRVDLYYNMELIATHARDYRKGKYTTNPEHLASKHRALLEWSPETFLARASAVGRNTTAVVARILEGRKHPEEGYKSCNGVLILSNRFGAQALERACAYAMRLEQVNYHVMVNILEKRLYEEDDDRLPLIHGNIRGEGYFAVVPLDGGRGGDTDIDDEEENEEESENDNENQTLNTQWQ